MINYATNPVAEVWEVIFAMFKLKMRDLLCSPKQKHFNKMFHLNKCR